MVGDYDYKTGLDTIMNEACNLQGCDPGAPQILQFNWTQPTHFAMTATSNVTMSGSIDNSGPISTLR